MSEATDTCLFSLNETANVTMDNQTGQLNFNYTQTGLINGNQYNITFRCNDTVTGNAIHTFPYYFNIDTSFPTIDFVNPTPTDNNITSNNYIFINVTSNDTGTNPAWFRGGGLMT
jgi:hypothetical protein